MEIQVKGGSMSFQIQRDKVCITDVHVEKERVEIPALIQEYPIVSIGKKAFLGQKMLREVVIPDSIEEIGEWAFAHCSNLNFVHIPAKEISFGKGAFKDCVSLKEFVLSKEETVSDGEGGRLSSGGVGNPNTSAQIGALLAAVPVLLDAPYLLSPTEAGELNWLEKWDARLLALLEKPDREGYSKQVLCGEEDLMASIDVYLAERRRQKAFLCYVRLQYDLGLSGELKEVLQKRLKEHTKGCESEAAWEILLEQEATGELLQIFADAGCITEENFEDLLSDLPGEDAEKRAWLLRYRDAHMQKNDFFDEMVL